MIVQRPLVNVEVAGQLDHDLNVVREAILALDPDGSRFARAIRRTFDMLLDGVHTGRYRWEQLHKTEKTHCGTLVEINLQREFQFGDGDLLDYKIAGIEVDCKYSQDDWKWMIPPEAIGQVLLVVWASDRLSLFKAGLVRATDNLLSAGRGNRDGKRTLSSAGRAHVIPLFTDGPIPENVLLRLSPVDEAAVFAHRSGQQRVNELFRRAQCRLVSRSAVATVAQQHDYMKRVRYNGGARKALIPDGIVILGQYEAHRQIAMQLGIPVPGRGEFVSVRLAPRGPHHGDTRSANISGRDWVVATVSDDVVDAPLLPSTRSNNEESD